MADPSGYCPACVGAAVGFVGGGLVGAGYYAFTASTSLTWGQFLYGAANAFQTGALAGAIGGSGGAMAGTLAGGGSLVDAAPFLASMLGSQGQNLTDAVQDIAGPLTSQEIAAIAPTGQQGRLIDQLFKTGIDNPELTNDTLEAYIPIAPTPLSNPANPP